MCMQSVVVTLWCGGGKSRLYKGPLGGLVPNGAAGAATRRGWHGGLEGQHPQRKKPLVNA